MPEVLELDINNIKKQFSKEMCKIAEADVYGFDCGASLIKAVKSGLALHALDCSETLTQEQIDCMVLGYRSGCIQEELLAGSETAALLSGTNSPTLVKPQIKSRNVTINRDANGLVSSIDYGTVMKTITRDENLHIVQMKITTS